MPLYHYQTSPPRHVLEPIRCSLIITERIFVGLIYDNPGYHARDYEEDHYYQEDDAECSLRSTKRLACRDFNTMGDIGHLRRSRGNGNSAVRSPPGFGNDYTILYIYGGLALSCPESPAISACIQGQFRRENRESRIRDIFLPAS